MIPHHKVRFDSDYHPFYDAIGHIRRFPSAMLSIPHMIVVFIVVLVVFGPQKLPELARGLGKLMAEFRKASTDFKSAFEEEMRDLERQALQSERKKAAEAAAASAAAEPSQPATLASPAGTESAPSDVADARATEAPVISPVAESVPRSSEEPAETNTETAAVTNSQDSPHDTQHPA
jgi:sec-independent protein translocase protein TatB